MDRRRVAVWALFCLSPLLIAAKCEGQSSCTGDTKNVIMGCPDAKKIPEPGPDTKPHGVGEPKPQADPNPHDNTATKKSGVPTTVQCLWGGQRWFQITPEVGGEPLVTFERNAREGTRGGEWSDTYRLAPGTQVGVTCAPLKNTGDDQVGFAQCAITQDNRIIGHPQGYAHVQHGKVRCWAITPL